MTIYYDADADDNTIITGGTVDLVLGSISETTCTDTFESIMKSDVTFRKAGAATVEVEYSGRPGYLYGHPLIFGNNCGNTNNCEVPVEGAFVNGIAKDGSCELVVVDGTYTRHGINAIQDAIYQCTYELTVTELETLCQDTANGIGNSLAITSPPFGTQTWVGVWGQSSATTSSNKTFRNDL